MFFFFKQKTAYELRISDWSSDVCSSDLLAVADRGSDGNIDSAHAAIYGGVGAGALRLRAGLGYAWLDLDTSRTIAFRGFTDSATARYDGSVVQFFTEAGYRFDVGRFALEPFAGLTALWTTTEAFAEQGGEAALNVHGRDRDVHFTTLGMRAEARFGAESPLAANLQLGWRRAFNELEPTASSTFRAGGQAFTVTGAPLDRDSFLIDGGLDWLVARRLTVGARYAGVVGNRSQDHAAKATLSFSF